MGEVTHEQANLLLKLYDLRREPRLREARAWYGQHFDAKNTEEMNKKYPIGSEGNAFFRMVVSYWDMAAGLVRSKKSPTHGLSAPGHELIVKDRQIDCLLPQIPGIIAGVKIVGEAMEVVDPHS